MNFQDKSRNERTPLDREHLLYLRDLVEEKTGLYFADHKLEDIAIAFASVLNDLPDSDALRLWRQITGNSAPPHPSFLRFISHLTVGETYFFRYAPDFTALQEQILPDLISRRATTSREIRIWSVACSTGEEPYSLAILMKDLIGDLSDWTVYILGTDIDNMALQKAKCGSFGRWSFRGVPEEIQSRCFTKSDDEIIIRPDYRKMVTFQQLNLLDSGWPSRATGTERMDLVLCRNVLIYFRSPTIIDISNRIFDALVPDGILMVSHTEHGSDLHPRFQREILPETIVYRKGSSATEGDHLSTKCETRPEKRPMAISGKARRPSPPVAEAPEWSPLGHPVNPLTSRTKSIDSTMANKFEPIRGEAQETVPAAADSQNSDTQLEMANAHFAARNYDAAVRCLSGFNSEALVQFEACLLIARSYANLGLLEEGAEWCSRAVKLNPLDAESYHLSALLKINIGRLPDAIIDLRRAIFLNPDMAIAYFELGNCLKAVGQWQQGVKAYEEAVKLLAGMAEADTVPFSDGLAAGQLKRVAQRGLQACGETE